MQGGQQKNQSSVLSFLDIRTEVSGSEQNLKIKSFLAASRNAVMTQIWIAPITLLMITYYRFMTNLNLFARNNLKDLFEPGLYTQCAQVGNQLYFNV